MSMNTLSYPGDYSKKKKSCVLNFSVICYLSNSANVVKKYLTQRNYKLVAQKKDCTLFGSSAMYKSFEDETRFLTYQCINISRLRMSIEHY